MTDDHEDFVEQRGETKGEAFLRLANYRLPKAVKRMRMIGNLSNTNVYEYTPEQAERLVSVLQSEVDKIRDAFSGKSDEDIPTIF